MACLFGTFCIATPCIGKPSSGNLATIWRSLRPDFLRCPVFLRWPVFSHCRVLLLLPMLWLGLLAATGTAAAADPILRSGDSLALVGGTFIERMQANPWLEAELQLRRSDWQLRVRNLGWSGDDVHGFARKVFDPNPEKGFQRLQYDLDLANPTAVLLAYGFAEASNGGDAVERFEPGLVRLVESQLERQRRVILMRPFVLPGVRTKGYEDSIRACAETVDRVGERFGLPVIGVTCDDFIVDGLLPSERGYRDIASQLAERLVGGSADAVEAIASTQQGGELGRLILRKDELFFHRHRPQNETYLLLFRKHEQGNNAVELPQFDPLIDELESQIWRLAQRPEN